MGKTAIILGASGLTGSIVLKKLLADKRYKTIKLFSRKSTGISHPKILEKVGNIIALENFKNDFKADEVYCCIGTTTKKTPNKTVYKNIDFGIPSTAAKLTKENKISTFLVVSALGANSQSSVFYNKTKGAMEQAVLEQKIPNTYILRPSIISGKRNENRALEKIGLSIFKLFNPLLVGKLKKYRAISANSIAQAMINLANSNEPTQIISSDKIEIIATINNKL
jgi:uncharacterized protein YbjT (DUF2867 family)